MQLTVKGSDGTISFDGQTVTITRSGVLGRALHGGASETRIPVDQITGVEVKKPGVSRGRITLIVAGTVQRPGGMIEHGNDPMSVQWMRNREDVEALRDAIQAAILSQRQAGAPAGSQPAAQDRYAQLERLAGLRDSGVLDEAEFQREKQRILGGGA